MSIDYNDYPNNWKWLSKQIVKDANNKCELCYAPNNESVQRYSSKIADRPWYPPSSDRPGKATKIILTVHHIDGDKSNSTKQNLIALCQKCHLRLDLLKHMNNRAKNKAMQKEPKLEI